MHPIFFRLALAAALLIASRTTFAEPDVAARPPPLEDALPRGVPFEERIEEIQRRIQAALVYPPLARRREVEGTSLLAFDISPAGQARHLELVRSSGSALLDRAAARAVAEAAPLPPVLGRLRVPVHFQLKDSEARP